MLMNNCIKLGFYPTPIEKLENISEQYPDYQIYIKRDDQTGLATGGNKTRKLEFLLQDAIDKGCNTIITSGALQSNHCRQTAAAANKVGLKCHLVLRGSEPEQVNGNLLLNKLLGATLHYVDESSFLNFDIKLHNSLSKAGAKPYIIPVGGSNEIGAMGYVNAVNELVNQEVQLGIKFDSIFFASCSGGTHAGLIIGKQIYNLESKIVGINISKNTDPNHNLTDYIKKIISNYSEKNNLESFNFLEDVTLIDGYNESGYGVVTTNEVCAIKLLAEKEGILLDPVYTARAFYGMIDMLGKGLINPGSNILFWHTGGIVANFGLAEEILKFT